MSFYTLFLPCWSWIYYGYIKNLQFQFIKAAVERPVLLESLINTMLNLSYLLVYNFRSIVLMIIASLQNNTTFRNLSLVYGPVCTLCFSGTKVDWWLADKNVIFSSLHFCLLFVFYLYACGVEILKFQDSVYLKSERTYHTINIP